MKKKKRKKLDFENKNNKIIISIRRPVLWMCFNVLAGGKFNVNCVIKDIIDICEMPCLVRGINEKKNMDQC